MGNTSKAGKSYLQRISIDKDAQSKEQAKADAQDAKIQVESDLMAAKRSLNQAQRDLESAKSAKPFDVNEVLDAQRLVEETQADVESITALKAELFDDVSLD